jgi:hypothetical protein
VTAVVMSINTNLPSEGTLPKVKVVNE